MHFSIAAIAAFSLRRALYAQQREEREKIFLLLRMRSERQFSEQIVRIFRRAEWSVCL